MDSEPDSEPTIVYIVVGRAFREEEAGAEGAAPGEGVQVNVLLTASDDQDCIQRALVALAGQGFARVELDQIGVIEGEPEDPTFASAYWNAIDGQVAVIAFHG